MGTATNDNDNDQTSSSIMKSVIALCLLGLALAAPRPQEEEAIILPEEVAEEVVAVEEAPVVQDLAPVQAVISGTAGEPVLVLRQETGPVIGAVFSHELQLDNGIAETRSGSEGPAGTSVMQGSYTIPLGNGEVATFNWVADENGYRVESPFLPTAPPAPAHVAEQLRIAEEQRAAGVNFDGPAAAAVPQAIVEGLTETEV